MILLNKFIFARFKTRVDITYLSYKFTYLSESSDHYLDAASKGIIKFHTACNSYKMLNKASQFMLDMRGYWTFSPPIQTQDTPQVGPATNLFNVKDTRIRILLNQILFIISSPCGEHVVFVWSSNNVSDMLSKKTPEEFINLYKDI